MPQQQREHPTHGDSCPHSPHSPRKEEECFGMVVCNKEHTDAAAHVKPEAAENIPLSRKSMFTTYFIATDKKKNPDRNVSCVSKSAPRGNVHLFSELLGTVTRPTLTTPLNTPSFRFLEDPEQDCSGLNIRYTFWEMSG